MLITESKSTLIIEGVIFMALGILALALPVATTLSATLLIGILCVIAGVVQFYRTFRYKKMSVVWLSLLNALLVFIVGIILLAYPVTGMMALTALLGIWFLVSGISQIILSLQIKHRHPNWGVLMVSGITSLILSIIIWYGWPVSSLWLIGVLIGVNLLFFGISLLALAFHIIE